MSKRNIGKEILEGIEEIKQFQKTGESPLRTSTLQLINSNRDNLPAKFRGNDVRYSESLVEYFVDKYTKPGDLVFDPFAGYGTTLIVAEEMGRRALGIEFLFDRVAFIKSQIKDPNAIMHGDSLKLSTYNLPKFKLSITSPPFMVKDDPENPFTGYTTKGEGYEAYLLDIALIYSQVKDLMMDDAKVIIEVANLKRYGVVTTLAWDIGKAVSKVLHFEGEIIVDWDHYSYGYDHSYCLVFSK